MRNRISINGLGYMNGMPKSAVCRVPGGIFYLVDAVRGSSVYAGRLSKGFYDKESGDTVRLADFSDYNVNGQYFIRSGYRRSKVFHIADAPYKSVRGEILHGIYVSRCGFDFTSDEMYGRTAGRYIIEPCHTEQITFNGRLINPAGGWHCYGGYAKETAAACLVTADMMYARRLFKDSFEKQEAELVDDEIRWGLEWLLSMQDIDGGAFEGVFPAKIFSQGPREDDPDEYRMGEKLCRPTLRMTALAAMGAVYFKSIDKRFSGTLRSAAERGWLWIVESPEYRYYSSKSGNFSPDSDGAYPLEGDFMWTLCEMYAMTGDESFAGMIEKKYMMSEFTGFGEDTCGGFAALSYLLSEREHDRTVEAFIKKKLADRGDRMWIAVSGSGYRTARSASGGYRIGSNFGVLCDCMSFISAYLVSGEQKYLEGAVDQLSYIFGVNPLNLSYITGSSPDRCCHPCHRLSTSNEGEHTVSGLIVAGPNSLRSDEYSKWHIEKGSPPAKCYVDSEYSHSTNQPSVHYSAPMIFISAFFDRPARNALAGSRKPVY